MSGPYAQLLTDICVRLGFCGSVVGGSLLNVALFLPQTGNVTAEDFASALFMAEGLDPDAAEALLFRAAVVDAFVKHMGGSEIDAHVLG